MALTSCRECGQRVSTEAYSCPHCGVPSPAGAFTPVPPPHAQPAVADLPPPPPRPRKASSDGMPLALLLCGIGALFILLLLVNAGGTSGSRGPGPGYGALDTTALPAGLDTGSAARPAPASGWQLDSTRSEMDDSPLVSLRVEARDEIPAPIEQKRPLLVIRCREHATNLYVLTYSAAQVEYGNYNGATVRLRLDDRKAFAESWSESTGSDALFAPAPIALARQLASADTFRFQFVPFSAPVQTITFPVSGLAAKLGHVSSACHWK